MLILLAAIGAGTALAIIADQDESRAGKALGVLMTAIAITVALYIVLGKHWL